MVAASGFKLHLHFSARVAGQETQTQMVSYGVYEIFKNLRTTASETCCFTWSVLLSSYTLAQIDTWFLYHNLQFRLPILPFITNTIDIIGRLLLHKYLSCFQK